MTCKNCDKEKPIANKHFTLCLQCNTERLNKGKVKSGSKIPPYKKQALRKPKINNSYFVKKTIPRKTTKEKIEEDNKFYKECFDSCKVHECEECGASLPENFLDDSGKVAARWRFSHVVPKSVAKHLRHVVDNINHLCLKCHTKWENGDKKSMRIFNKNKKRFSEYF